MVKVGGYILGEFGNLIAGDPRSRYLNNFLIITGPTAYLSAFRTAYSPYISVL
jgi:hypothetical protein